MSLILASNSPRRKELLSLITTDFTIETAKVNEGEITKTYPDETALARAEQKCMAVAKKHLDDVTIGCDTVVELNGEMLGKPTDEDMARKMLQSLSGTRHMVHTGVYIFSRKCSTGFVKTSIVDFAKIPDEEIEKYIKTTEPYDKAGGYGIQGWAAKFICHIDGCYYNIMGLPVEAVYSALNAVMEK